MYTLFSLKGQLKILIGNDLYFSLYRKQAQYNSNVNSPRSRVTVITTGLSNDCNGASDSGLMDEC